MTTQKQNEARELACNEIDTIAGGDVPWGPYYQLPPTGFGARTDARLAQQRLLEANFRG